MDQNKEVENTQVEQAAPAVSNADTLPKASRVFKEAWSVFKSNFWKFQALSWLPIGAMLVAALVIGIVTAILLPVLGYSYSAQSLTALLENPIVFFVAIILGFVLAVAFGLFSSWVQITLVYASGRPEASVRDAFAATKHKVLTFIWVGILYALIMMGGGLLLIVPGIYLAIVLSLYVYVVAFENEQGLNALIKSREYTRGRFWKLVKYGLYSLVIVVPVWLVSIALSMIFRDTSLSFIPDVIGRIIGTVLAPLFIAYGYGIYKTMKESRVLAEFAPTTKTRRKYAGLGILGLLMIPAVVAAITLASLNAARESAPAETSQATEYVGLTLPENWEYVQGSGSQLGARRADDKAALFVQTSPVISDDAVEPGSIEDVTTLEEFETSIRSSLADDEQVHASLADVDGYPAFNAEYLDYDLQSQEVLRVREYLLVRQSTFISIVMVGLDADESLSSEFDKLFAGIDIK